MVFLCFHVFEKIKEEYIQTKNLGEKVFSGWLIKANDGLDKYLNIAYFSGLFMDRFKVRYFYY